LLGLTIIREKCYNKGMFFVAEFQLIAILKILYLPDERLRIVSKPVTEFNDELQTLIDDMFETMYDARGVGLAASQIGLNIRLSVNPIKNNWFLLTQKSLKV